MCVKAGPGWLLNCAAFTVHCAAFTAHCAAFTVHCAAFTVRCQLSTVPCVWPTADTVLTHMMSKASNFGQLLALLQLLPPLLLLLNGGQRAV